MKNTLNRILCIFLSFLLGFGAGHMLYTVFIFLMIDKVYSDNIVDTDNNMNYMEDVHTDYTNLDTVR